MARICLSFFLFNHNAHPHLVSPEPWLKAPSPHWQPVTPALHKHTSHSSQASDLVSTKWTPEAISDIFSLLTFLLTYLLCPLQHCVLRSPVSSFSSDLLSVHPSLILRVCGSFRVHKFLSRHIPSSHLLIIPLIRYFEYQTYHPVICITLLSK